MSVKRAELVRALHAVTSGRATVWAPQITTHQVLNDIDLVGLLQQIGAQAENTFNEGMFFVYYKGDVQPDADDPAWTEVLSGTVAHSSDGDIFTIVDDSDAEHLYFYITETLLGSSKGTIVEAKVKVLSSGAGLNRGAAISIFDGTYQSVAWLRADGVNIDGQSDVAIDMTSYRRVKLIAKDGGSALYIDGSLRQTGSYMNETAKKQITFGSWVSP